MIDEENKTKTVQGAPDEEWNRIKNNRKMIEWWGVYDGDTAELIYVYKNESAALNQASRGSKNWVHIPVKIYLPDEINVF